MTQILFDDDVVPYEAQKGISSTISIATGKNLPIAFQYHPVAKKVE